MPAKRCSGCSTNWPTSLAAHRCPNCGGTLWYSKDETADTAPDKTKADTQELPAATPQYAHRAERFLALGFSEVDAHRLACAKDGVGFPVYHGDVGKMLAAGCSHEQAVGIFA